MRVVSHPPREDIELTAIFHALSDPARLGIVRDLAARNEMSCSVLTSSVNLSKSTLSHHLRILREAGLTVTRIDGVRRQVSLRTEDIETRFPGLLKQVLLAAGLEDRAGQPRVDAGAVG